MLLIQYTPNIKEQFIYVCTNVLHRGPNYYFFLNYKLHFLDKKKVQHLHFVSTDAICKNLLQNAAKFITYCVQEFYHKMWQIITKCGIIT